MSAPPKQIIVSGGFDDIRSSDLRFLQEAAKPGELSVLPWPDAAIQKLSGAPPKFPLAERNYFLRAVRFVKNVLPADNFLNSNELPKNIHADIWADLENPQNAAREKFCRENKIAYQIFNGETLKNFPAAPPTPSVAGRKKVVVTGSFDWFHSGHVRFFEEVSALGDLFVIVGHDANIRLLKGAGHPLIPQDERRYVVGSIKFVKQALISSGNGWLDADPEIQKLKPDIYAVNEDGDKGGKREYCEKNGIEYIVLQRVPAPGLPKRSSTDLRKSQSVKNRDF